MLDRHKSVIHETCMALGGEHKSLISAATLSGTKKIPISQKPPPLPHDIDYFPRYSGKNANLLPEARLLVLLLQWQIAPGGVVKVDVFKPLRRSSSVESLSSTISCTL